MNKSSHKQKNALTGVLLCLKRKEQNMTPIKFLKPEIAEKIEEATSEFLSQKPMDKVVLLKCVFDTKSEYKYFDKETADTIRDIIENHPEQLLLHFATYDPKIKSHASFVTPISDEIDCITVVRKNHTEYSPSAVYSYLERKDSDIVFDLTLVDTHDLDYGDDEEPYIMSYLYGNPYNEDWQHSQKTEFKAIADVIENND